MIKKSALQINIHDDANHFEARKVIRNIQIVFL